LRNQGKEEQGKAETRKNTIEPFHPSRRPRDAAATPHEPLYPSISIAHHADADTNFEWERSRKGAEKRDATKPEPGSQTERCDGMYSQGKKGKRRRQRDVPYESKAKARGKGKGGDRRDGVGYIIQVIGYVVPMDTAALVSPIRPGGCEPQARFQHCWS
jgi:hypothetical protein